MPIAVSNPGPLLGRDAEVELLVSLLDGVQDGGGALVLYGEPGIGKSRLLAVAAGLARERGFTVLSATGVQSEAHLPFAGLHQLVRPLRSRVADLPAAQRAALDAAFGLGQEPAPERFQIAMAVLDLLGEVATGAPLLILAEDAQWLDHPTTEVLAFVARRLQSDPVVLLAAVREGYPSPLVDAGLPQHRLGGLGPAEAMTLLDASAQQLSPVVRDRLLSEAAGNPLALMELPVSAAGREPVAPGSLPLTQRLEQAFAARVSDLPEATRLLLLVAAHSDDERLGDIIDAAGAVSGSTLGLDLLEPAAEAALVDLDLHSVRFRHPLIRSAVRQSASLLRRRRVHEALAEVLRAEPDRRVWHRAALISGTHEEIANELEEAAGRARRRGALAVALTAWQRAAELSPPGPRVRRLLATAELAFELGQRNLVPPLLREVEHLDPDPLQRARATWIEELVQTRPLGDASRAAALIATAEQAGQAGDRDLQLDLTWLVASRAWLVDPAPTARQVLVEAADRLGDPESADLRILAIQAYADPFGKAPAIFGVCGPPRPMFTATRTPPVSWGRPRWRWGPSISRRRSWPRRSRVYAGKDGSGTCRACSRCRETWQRTSPTGAWRFPRRKRPGAWRPSSASRNGSRPPTPSIRSSPGSVATRTRPSEPRRGPSASRCRPGRTSPSPSRNSAGSSPHSERAGTPTPTRPPNASWTRRARPTIGSSRAGS